MSCPEDQIKRLRDIIHSQSKLIEAYKFQLYGLPDISITQVPVRILIHHKKLYEDYITIIVNLIDKFLNNCKSIVECRIKKLAITTSSKNLTKCREDIISKLNYNNEKIFFKNVYLSETSEFDIFKRLKRKRNIVNNNTQLVEHLEKQLKYVFDKEQTLALYDLSKEELINNIFNVSKQAEKAAALVLGPTGEKIESSNKSGGSSGKDLKNPYKNVENKSKSKLGFDPTSSSKRKFDPNNPDLLYGEKKSIDKEKVETPNREKKDKKSKKDKKDRGRENSKDRERMERDKSDEDRRNVSFGPGTKENDAMGASKKLAKKKKKDKKNSVSINEDSAIQNKPVKKEKEREKYTDRKISSDSDSDSDDDNSSSKKRKFSEPKASSDDIPSKKVKSIQADEVEKVSKRIKSTSRTLGEKKADESKEEVSEKKKEKEKENIVVKTPKSEPKEKDQKPKSISQKPKYKPVISSTLLSSDTSSLGSDSDLDMPKSTSKSKKPEKKTPLPKKLPRKEEKERPKERDKPKKRESLSSQKSRRPSKENMSLLKTPKLARKNFTCYACFESNKISKQNGPFKHPNLPVNVCSNCNEFLKLGGWTYNEADGKCDYCFISGEGGDIMSCDTCENSFITNVLKQWYGDDYIDKLEEDESIVFKCMKCDPDKGYMKQYLSESKICFEVLEEIKKPTKATSSTTSTTPKKIDKSKSKIISSSDSDTEEEGLSKSQTSSQNSNITDSIDSMKISSENTKTHHKIVPDALKIAKANKNLDLSDDEDGNTF